MSQQTTQDWLIKLIAVSYRKPKQDFRGIVIFMTVVSVRSPDVRKPFFVTVSKKKSLSPIFLMQLCK